MQAGINPLGVRYETGTFRTSGIRFRTGAADAGFRRCRAATLKGDSYNRSLRN